MYLHSNICFEWILPYVWKSDVQKPHQILGLGGDVQCMSYQWCRLHLQSNLNQCQLADLVMFFRFVFHFHSVLENLAVYLKSLALHWFVQIALDGWLVVHFFDGYSLSSWLFLCFLFVWFEWLDRVFLSNDEYYIQLDQSYVECFCIAVQLHGFLTTEKSVQVLVYI